MGYVHDHHVNFVFHIFLLFLLRNRICVVLDIFFKLLLFVCRFTKVPKASTTMHKQNNKMSVLHVSGMFAENQRHQKANIKL